MIAFYLAILASDEDKALFTEVYRKYEGAMYNIAYNILNDSFLAEDAVHDAFLRLVNYISKIQNANCHKTRALIVIISRSSAIDIYRKRSRQFAEEIYSVEHQGQVDDAGLPLDQVISDESFEEFRIKLQGLHKDYLDIILLRYAYDYSTEDISSILCITTENVRKRLSRAKQAAQRLLKETEPIL